MKTTTLLSTFGLAALLAACGGGGDGDNASVQPPASQIDAYVGTWKTGCFESDLATVEAPTVHLTQTMTTSFTKVSDSKLSMVVRDDFYTSDDCSGTARVSHTNTSALNTVVIDGSTTVGGAAAQKVTSGTGPLGGGISSGTTVTLNGVIYPGDFFVEAEDPSKALIQVTATTMTFGLEAPLDAQGYPTTLNADLQWVRQP